MNSSVRTYHKHLRDEVSLVEQEIESHLQQSETLKTRLEGLKRALELCDAEQSAVAELLRLGASGLELADANPSRAPAAASKQPLPVRKGEPTPRKPPMAMRNAQRARKAAMAGAHAVGNGAMTRIDMIVATLKRHPRLTVRELIAALEREFRWKCGESNLTAHLYTNPNRFAHSKADRAGKQLVTWSLR